MRIIAGKHRGKPLRVPRSAGLRPTADRVRESVFNILVHGIGWGGFDGSGVIDLFAGTGAYGLEALSRGADHATFIDIDPAALAGIRRNAATMGEARSVSLLRLDASKLPPPPRSVSTPTEIAFLDPPYQSGLAQPALHGLAACGWIRQGSLAVVEIAADEVLAVPPHTRVLADRSYGSARVVILELQR